MKCKSSYLCLSQTQAFGAVAVGIGIWVVVSSQFVLTIIKLVHCRFVCVTCFIKSQGHIGSGLVISSVQSCVCLQFVTLCYSNFCNIG